MIGPVVKLLSTSGKLPHEVISTTLFWRWPKKQGCKLELDRLVWKILRKRFYQSLNSYILEVTGVCVSVFKLRYRRLDNYSFFKSFIRNRVATIFKKSKRLTGDQVLCAFSEEWNAAVKGGGWSAKGRWQGGVGCAFWLENVDVADVVGDLKTWC